MNHRFKEGKQTVTVHQRLSNNRFYAVFTPQSEDPWQPVGSGRTVEEAVRDLIMKSAKYGGVKTTGEEITRDDLNVVQMTGIKAVRRMLKG